jgi:hypothetical protein
MRLYLKAEYRAAIALFRTGGSKQAEDHLQAITDHNSAISSQLYALIKEGGAAYQRHTLGKRLDIYHASTRHDGIQVSRFCLINGKWEALSHGDITTPEGIYKNLVKGRYVNLRRA